MQDSCQFVGASRIGEEARNNIMLTIETREEVMMESNYDIAAPTNSSPAVMQKSGNGYDASLTNADAMMQGCRDTINSSSENESSQSIDASISPVQTNQDGSFAADQDSTAVVEAPRVGMVFGSCEEIDKYYRLYGMQQGFGVVKPGSGFKGKNRDEKRNTTWKCECFGKPDLRRRQIGNGRRVRVEEEDIPRVCGKPRKSKKCGCTAMIYATVQPDGTWVLRKVVLEHKNHILTPGKSRDLKVSQRMSRRMFADMIADLSASQIHNILANQGNGLNRVPMTGKLVSSGQEGNSKFKVGDMNALQKFTMRMHQDNHKFLHFMRHDDSGYLKDVLWVDARSKAAYQEFGDVVCLDTTYCTNDYDLPLVNFVGENHHGQTVLFGCALMSHEDTETLVWLFRMWLLCMDGIEPLGILTDQASSIGKAVAAVMPKTVHRWSTWQIVRKFSTKLGLVQRYHELYDELKNTIYCSYTEEEFERRWAEVINEYQLQGNEWLQCLYEERHMWVPAYINHLFWAGMNSLPRAQSIRSLFDGIVGKHTKLCEFLALYCVAMEEMVRIEKDADDDCARCVRGVATHFTVESIFQKTYTDAKFRELQIECQSVLYCNSREGKLISGTESEHVMQDRVWIEVPGKRERIATNEKRLYRVRFNTSTNEVSCECKLFESSGILCRHCIRLYDLHSVSEVPEKYILRRWRKDIPRKHTRVKVAYCDPSNMEELKRYDMMQEAFEAVCSKAMENSEAFDIVIQSLAEMKLRVAECLEKHCAVSTVPMATMSYVGIEGENGIMNEVQGTAVPNGSIFGQDLNINGRRCLGSR